VKNRILSYDSKKPENIYFRRKKKMPVKKINKSKKMRNIDVSNASGLESFRGNLK